MGGQPETPRVGDSLTVHKDHVRFLVQVFPRFHQKGEFSEREESGDIGKGDIAKAPSDVHHFEIRPTANHDGCKPGHRPLFIRTVCSRDQ
jgi:hypothetical protein